MRNHEVSYEMREATTRGELQEQQQQQAQQAQQQPLQ